MPKHHIHDQIHAVVCSICERHYPLCEAQQPKVDISGHSSEMKILFNHGLQDVETPVTVPVVTIEVKNVELGDINKATIRLYTSMRVGNVDAALAHDVTSLAYLSHSQVHVLQQVNTINLMNFGMMLDNWLNVVGYMINDARVALDWASKNHPHPLL